MRPKEGDGNESSRRDRSPNNKVKPVSVSFQNLVQIYSRKTYHVIVGLLLLLLLLLFFFRCVRSGSSTTRSSRCRGGRRSAARADVREELLHVLALERLGEERRPDGLNFDLGGGGERSDLVRLVIRKIIRS